jgi:hypothetical protein
VRAPRARPLPLACALLAACAPSVTARAPTARHRPAAPVAVASEADARALDALVRGLVDLPSADPLGLTLARADGARALSGEPAPDDRVREASVVARVGASAAVLVTTACGDAWLVGVHLADGRWSAVGRAALVDDARPGACRLSHAAGEARAMIDREPREVVVTFDSESEEGDEARDPLLRVYHLDADGALTPLSGDIGFGGTDDATGAVRGATWVVDEALLLPRDLYVQVQPERPGPGGSAPPFVVRRTYHLQGPRLVLVDETSSPLRPRSPAATHAAHSAQ